MIVMKDVAEVKVVILGGEEVGSIDLAYILNQSTGGVEGVMCLFKFIFIFPKFNCVGRFSCVGFVDKSSECSDGEAIKSSAFLVECLFLWYGVCRDGFGFSVSGRVHPFPHLDLAGRTRSGVRWRGDGGGVG
jgi:hypothetical protein